MQTNGMDHLGLSVFDLQETSSFLTSVLGWKELARDETYPRNSMTDGTVRLTLWQVDRSGEVVHFDRRANVGLHHLALKVLTEADLNELAKKVSQWPGVNIEFMPELVGNGPRKHMMFREPGGLRLELIWSGE